MLKRASRLPNDYRVEGAANGGWVVIESGDCGRFSNLLGAFTTSDDLLIWLIARHEEIDNAFTADEAQDE